MARWLLLAALLALGADAKSVAKNEEKYLKRTGRKFLAAKAAEEGAFVLPSSSNGLQYVGRGRLRANMRRNHGLVRSSTASPPQSSLERSLSQIWSVSRWYFIAWRRVTGNLKRQFQLALPSLARKWVSLSCFFSSPKRHETYQSASPE